MEKLMMILILIALVNIVILMYITKTAKKLIENKTEELQTQIVDTEDRIIREKEDSEQAIIFEMVEQREMLEENIAENLAVKIEEECRKHLNRNLVNEKIYSNKILVVREAK